MRTKDAIVLRAAHAAEAGEIAKMSRLHIEHGLRWRWTPSKVRSSIKDPDTMALVASASGDVVGFAIMRFGDADAHLHLLAVAGKHRRGGIGGMLLRWLEKSCRNAGIRRIRAELRESNEGALAFYAALGFRRIGRIPGYYDRREAALVLNKRLVAETSV